MQLIASLQVVRIQWLGSTDVMFGQRLIRQSAQQFFGFLAGNKFRPLPLGSRFRKQEVDKSGLIVLWEFERSLLELENTIVAATGHA